mmetsp:Transcript_7859/g.23660  ORF Transcript_7859/g.23660 Transcript_7859/m.23660 type:complete len:378 (+) Transcript_7859:1449-2582(+)
MSCSRTCCVAHPPLLPLFCSVSGGGVRMSRTIICTCTRGHSHVRRYALYEELDAEDQDRAREVYRACLKLIPHQQFTFSKIWALAAKLEVRAKRLDAARKILGMALGMAPKDKTFKVYIELEMQMGNIDRCRRLYERYLEWNAANVRAWTKFAELEQALGETDRTRGIYELAIAQPVLDMPEALWKAYIDFEIGQGERARTRVLYERLLDRTKHVKVWLSYARFEADPLPSGDEEGTAASEEGEEAPAARAASARAVFLRAYKSLRETSPDAKEEAVLLLDTWKAFELGLDGVLPAEAVSSFVEKVTKKMPKRVKRKRPIKTDDGLQVGQEEYYDYIFPEEAGAAPHLKLLELAYKHKRQKMAQEDDGDDALAGPPL